MGWGALTDCDALQRRFSHATAHVAPTLSLREGGQVPTAPTVGTWLPEFALRRGKSTVPSQKLIAPGLKLILGGGTMHLIRSAEAIW